MAYIMLISTHAHVINVFLSHNMIMSSQSVLCSVVFSSTYVRCFALLWVTVKFSQLLIYYKEKCTSPTVLAMLQVPTIYIEFQLLYFVPN